MLLLGSCNRFNPRLQPPSLSLQSDNLLLQLHAPRTRCFSILASLSNRCSQGVARRNELFLHSIQLLSQKRQLLLRSLPPLPLRLNSSSSSSSPCLSLGSLCLHHLSRRLNRFVSVLKPDDLGSQALDNSAGRISLSRLRSAHGSQSTRLLQSTSASNHQALFFRRSPST